MRDTLPPLFVVFSLAMLLPMLTEAGSSIAGTVGYVYEEFTHLVPNLLFLERCLPMAQDAY